MNCAKNRATGNIPYVVVFNRQPHYRRIAVDQRHHHSIEIEELGDEEEISNIQSMDPPADVTDEELEEFRQQWDREIAEREERRRRDEEALRRRNLEEEEESIRRRLEEAQKEEEFLRRRLEEAHRNREANRETNPDLQPSGSGRLFTEGDGEVGASANAPAPAPPPPPFLPPQPPPCRLGDVCPDSQPDFDEESEEENTSVGNKENAQTHGIEVPRTPPNEHQNHSTTPHQDDLSPSFHRLQLGGPENPVELEDTPTTSVRREVIINQQRANERAKRNYGKQRAVRVYALGDPVSVAIPEELRSSTDDTRFFGKVIAVNEELYQYTILTKYGVLDRPCPVDILNPIADTLDLQIPEPPL